MVSFEKYYATEKEIEEHNQEVERVWEAYRVGKPIRVPCDWGYITPHRLIHYDENLSFKKYIFEPEELLRLQSLAQYLNNKIIMQDMGVKMPKKWSASLDYHTFADEAYWGCPVKFEDRFQPKVYHLYNKEKVDPDLIDIPDPFSGNFYKTIYENYLKLKELIKDYKAYDIPFSDDIEVYVCTRTYGLFNTALAMRGPEIFTDLYEDPDYVIKLMNKVADGYILRSKSWSKLKDEENSSRNTAEEGEPVVLSYEQAAQSPIAYDHGIHLISMEQYKRFLLPVYEKVKKAFNANSYDEVIEYCCTSEELIRFYHSQFKINKFWNLCGDVLDIEKLRYDLGDDAEFEITINPEVVFRGPVNRIEKAVKEVLRPEVKGKGNIIFGLHFDNWSAPMDHLLALYDAVKEYGGY